jgi:2-polyprenyl-6-methoxyphenol hydroxylase-like FAD-dependent oxidoreductase
MANILVVGGGMGGLSTAMLLAGDGHDVTVLERDPAPPPPGGDAAWDTWERRGVNQFRMIHYFLPRFRQIAERELPDAVAALDADGVLRFNPIAQAPAEVTGGFREEDRRFEAMTGRRPMVEAAFARTAEAMPNLTIRRGTSVDGLLTGDATAAVPHVVGVVIDGGEELRADLVVDATGRRSALPKLLAAIGAAAPIEELEDSGFVYYGRHYRSSDGSTPPPFGPALQAYDSVSFLTLPADNGTWGMGIVASAADAEMRAVKDIDTWERVVRSYPPLAGGGADHRHPAHGQDRGSPSLLRRRRCAGRHRRGTRRRFVGVHQPLGRAGGQHRTDPRRGLAGSDPRPRTRRRHVVRARVAHHHAGHRRAPLP